MSQKPLLIFPSPSVSEKTKGHGSKSSMQYPDLQTQINRLENRVTNLEQVFQNQTANFHSGIEGQVPEMILVFEIAGSIPSFFGAIKNTPGMEYLGEHQQDFTEPDEHFYQENKEGERKDNAIENRIFLSLTNNQAIAELIRFWGLYKNGEQLPMGVRKYKQLFEQLKEIRPYSVQDRIRDTGLENYLSDLRRDGETTIHFEIELTFRDDPLLDTDAFTQLSSLVQAAGGEMIQSSRVVINAIQYHACIAQAPIELFDDLTENTDIQFLKSERVLFFRPVGQTVTSFNPTTQLEETIEEVEVTNAPVAQGTPVAALLDGYPLNNHNLLRNRLLIDDPDNVENNYLAAGRLHGTEMASIILHGDLDSQEEVSNRLLYVFPLMRLTSMNPNFREELPKNKLPIDLIHRAVKRMFDGEGDTPPTAPMVKIINLSIGDAYRPFHFNMSAWAKLIDWLSEKYNVLFVISTGNFMEDIVLDIDHQAFTNLSAEEKKVLVGKAIIKENYRRKILTPSEAINAITVGACHHDASSGNAYPDHRIELMDDSKMMSLVSRIGFGYAQSMKPEILMPGGRKLYRYHLHKNNTPNKTIFSLEQNSLNPNPPGIRVAVPGTQGRLNETTYTCGTSNAAALATRLGVKIYDNLLTLNNTLPDSENIPAPYFTPLLKALLIHGANRGNATTFFRENMEQSGNKSIKKQIGAYLGYGKVNEQRVLSCTDQRATLLGFGELSKDEGAIFRFPLPDSIVGIQLQKKLTITLAWLSPINCKSGKYRKAQLFFDNIDKNQDDLNISRDSYDFRHAKKGTVQHDCLIGSSADAYTDKSDLIIKVSCKQDASGLKKANKIKYGLAVTLEILNDNTISIYDEIKARIQPVIQVST